MGTRLLEQLDEAMIPYTMHGVTFQADEPEGLGAFHVFNPDRPEGACDPSLISMVNEMRLFMDLTKDMTHLVDIGALFGVFSLMFTARPGTVAYAVEPSPYAWPFLLQHVVGNPSHKIVPIQKFLGDTTGSRIECARDWKHIVAGSSAPEMVSVHTTRLDDLPMIERADCIKLDVEGYECQVLRGGRNMIEFYRPLIFLECHQATLPTVGESPESLWKLIESLGYDVYDYGGVKLDRIDGAFNRVICKAK
jgi:FkbM family methyltransferase